MSTAVRTLIPLDHEKGNYRANNFSTQDEQVSKNILNII